MIAQLLAKISPLDFYQKVLGVPIEVPDNGQVKIKCPFHEKRLGTVDKTGSMGIDMSPGNGGRFNCLGCRARGRNYLAFYQLLHNIPWDNMLATLNGIATEFGLDTAMLKDAVVDATVINKYVQDLNETTAGQKLIEHLLTSRLLTVETIAKYKLGYDINQRRLAIPIYDAAGDPVNVRLWLPEYDRPEVCNNKVIGLPGLNTPSRLYPIENIQSKQIFICEGELDCLLLNSLGLKAVTATLGVSSFLSSWTNHFIGKEVILVLDSDAAGQSECDRIILDLQKVTESLKPVSIKEIVEFPGKDITDFFRAFGRELGKRMFVDGIENQSYFHLKDEWDDSRIEVSLFSCVASDVLYQDMSVKGIVIAKATTPFAIETRFKATCQHGKAMLGCPGCPFATMGRESNSYDIDMASADVSEICYNKNNTDFFKKKIGVTCNKCKIELEPPYANFEEVVLSPELQSGMHIDERTQTFYQRNALVKSYDTEMGGHYKLNGKSVQGPDKKVLSIFTGVEQLDRINTNVNPDEEIICDGELKSLKEHLKIFQPNAELGETVKDKLTEIYHQLSQHVTRIIGRRNICQAVDITFHSPLAFNFGNEFHERGWISALIIGDSQCGKSETAKLMCRHLRAGDIHTGEHITPAGIIGSYSETEGRKGRMFRLGIAPRNDGKILIIDEAGAMDHRQIGLLTSMRSTGKARSTKDGQDNEYDARVRLIMVGNPHDRFGKPRTMRDYHYGCQTVPDFIGEEADITRFDIVTVCNVDEVPFDDINKEIIPDCVLDYTSDLCNLKLSWAWSRKPSQIKFTPAAQLLVRSVATEMASHYDQSIPIVASASQRWTIARIAVSIATILFSTPDGHDLMVTEEHVTAAEEFLLSCYNSKAMGYDVYSSKKKLANVVINPSMVRQSLDNMPYELYLSLTELDEFNLTSLSEHSTIEKVNISMHLKKLRLLNCVIDKKTSSGKLVLSPGFRRFLQHDYEHPEAKKLYENLEKGQYDSEAYVN